MKFARRVRTYAAALMMALAVRVSDGGEVLAAPMDSASNACLPPRPDVVPPVPPAPAAGDNPDLTGALAHVRAIEQWLDWMSLGGSVDHVLLGVAAPADLAAVQLGTRSVLPMAGLAAKLIDRGIDAHDRSPARGEPAMEELVSRAIHARTVLLPLRVARLTLLSAALEPSESRARQLRETAGKMAASAEPVSPWADVERSFLIGLAWLGNGAFPEASEHFARATTTLAEAGTTEQVREELGVPVRVAAALSGGPNALDALLRNQMEMAGPREAELIASAVWRASTGGRAPVEAAAPAFRGYHAAFAALSRAHSPGETSALLLNRMGAVVGPDVREYAPSVVRVASMYQRSLSTPESETIRGCVALALELHRAEPAAAALAAWVPFRTRSESHRHELARAACELGEAGITPSELAREAVQRLSTLDPASDPALFQRVVILARAQGVELVSAGTGRSIDPTAVLVASSWNAPYEEAERLLGDATPPQGVPDSVLRGWSQLLDRLLRDPDEVGGERARLRRVAERSLLAAPADARGDDAVLLRIDSLLALDRLEAAEVLAGAMPAETHPLARLLVQVARMNSTGAQDALGALVTGGNGEPSLPHAVRLLSDRGWALIAERTRGFADESAPESVRAAALGLALTMVHIGALEPGQQDAARERAAWGLLFAGDAPRAMEAFRDIITRAGKRSDLLRGLGESALSSGDDAAAFSAFRDIASATRPDGEGARDYFHAWARMLEILQRKSAGADRAGVIAREVRRLRLLDPARSCPRCAERIDAVARAAGL